MAVTIENSYLTYISYHYTLDSPRLQIDAVDRTIEEER